MDKRPLEVRWFKLLVLYVGKPRQLEIDHTKKSPGLALLNPGLLLPQGDGAWIPIFDLHTLAYHYFAIKFLQCSFFPLSYYCIKALKAGDVICLLFCLVTRIKLGTHNQWLPMVRMRVTDCTGAPRKLWGWWKCFLHQLRWCLNGAYFC